MAKQEEIRDTVRRLLQFMRDVPEKDPIEDDVIWLLRCLHSQGVVIKVDNGDDLTGCCIARLEPLIEEV